MSKSIETLRKTAEARISEIQNAERKVNEKEAETRLRITELNQKKADCMKKGSFEEYADASAEIAKMEAVLEMCEKMRKETLKSARVTPEEFTAFRGKVQKVVSEATEKEWSALGDLVGEVERHIRAVEEVEEQGNNALQIMMNGTENPRGLSLSEQFNAFITAKDACHEMCDAVRKVPEMSKRGINF